MGALQKLLIHLMNGIFVVAMSFVTIEQVHIQIFDLHLSSFSNRDDKIRVYRKGKLQK